MTMGITRFNTSDSPQQVIAFYRDNLTKAGWVEIEEDTTPNNISFAYSVEGTVAAASSTNHCAPTPETDLAGHGVDVIITEATTQRTTVEIKLLSITNR